MTLTELHFTSDNPSYTQIYNAAETDILKIIYDIFPYEDSETHRFYTIVKRAGSEIARLEWHESTPDVVTWKDQDVLAGSTRMNIWMRPSVVPFKQCVLQQSKEDFS